MRLFLTSKPHQSTMLRSSSARAGLWGLGGVTGWIFFTDNCYDFTRITGNSMAPSLSPLYHETRQSDWIWWRKHNLRGNLKRGDIVMFYSPYQPEEEAVKRVIALPGDTVTLDKKRRPKRDNGADIPESTSWDRLRGTCKIPEGHVWVEGDNWRTTRDSNTYGPISMSLINGKAVQVVLPLKNFGKTPWDAYRSKTKVVPGEVVKVQEEEILNRIFQG